MKELLDSSLEMVIYQVFKPSLHVTTIEFDCEFNISCSGQEYLFYSCQLSTGLNVCIHTLKAKKGQNFREHVAIDFRGLHFGTDFIISSLLFESKWASLNILRFEMIYRNITLFLR